VRSGETLKLTAEAFNLTNADSFRDPATASLLLDPDGTIRTGLGDPRGVQLGARYVF
jgi:hypothetical protein